MDDTSQPYYTDDGGERQVTELDALRRSNMLGNAVEDRYYVSDVRVSDALDELAEQGWEVVTMSSVGLHASAMVQVGILTRYVLRRKVEE